MSRREGESKVEYLIRRLKFKCIFNSRHNSDAATDFIPHVLELYGFHTLSEEKKHEALTSWRFSSSKGYERIGNKTSVLEVTIKKHKEQWLEVLLPLTPVHRISENNIPADLIRMGHSYTGMQSFLYATQARWKPEGCDCVDHNMVNPNNETKQCVTVNLASSILSAELFHYAIRKRAIGCVKYLLQKTPNLMKINVNGRTALHVALMDEQYVFNDVFTMRAPIANTCLMLSDVYSKNINPCIISYATSMSPGHEHDISAYRDEMANTLLHLLYSRSFLTQVGDSAYLLYCTRMLISAGLDPSDRNIDNERPIDILMQQ